MRYVTNADLYNAIVYYISNMNNLNIQLTRNTYWYKRIDKPLLIFYSYHILRILYEDFS